MFEKAWSIYLKMVAIAPLVGIAYLWSYLRGSNISLMGFIGSSPQILVGIGLIGFAALAYSVLTVFAGIFLPHRFGISRALLDAMCQQPLAWWRHAGTPDERRPLYWIAVILVLPCFAGMVIATYVAVRNGFWWLLGMGVTPSLVAWAFFSRSGFGGRMKAFYALLSLVFTAFSTVGIAFFLFLAIKSCFPYVYYVPEKRSAHMPELLGYHGGLVILMMGLSVLVTWIFAPTSKGSAVIKAKLSTVIGVVIATSFLGITPVYIVQDAFGLFADGGEHRIYSSMSGKALVIPESACADHRCATSKEIRIAADLGNSIYAWFDFPLPNGKTHELLLRKIDTAGTTYKVVKTDPVLISNLQIL